jgi:hypothetical protein
LLEFDDDQIVADHLNAAGIHNWCYSAFTKGQIAMSAKVAAWPVISTPSHRWLRDIPRVGRTLQRDSNDDPPLGPERTARAPSQAASGTDGTTASRVAPVSRKAAVAPTRSRRKSCQRRSSIRPNKEQSVEHVRLCVLALQMQRAAEIRCALPWSRTAHELAALKTLRYHAGGRTIVQRTRIADSLGGILKNLGVSILKPVLSETVH